MAYNVEKFGDYSERRSFAKTKNVLELENLLDIQKESYRDFLENGIKEAFEDLFPVVSFAGNTTLELGDYYLEAPRYSIKEAKERMVNYAAPLKVDARLFIHETGEVKEHSIFLGDMPLMTESGTFIINGAERVIVSQLVRSPSIYYKKEIDKNGRRIVGAEVIPNKGTWLEYETDVKNIVYVRIDRTRKIAITTFLRALGLSTDDEIIKLFGDNDFIRATLEKDETTNTEEALIAIFEKLRPGEPATLESTKNQLITRFFDSFRYDLSKVGRYKFNKKLNVLDRAMNAVLAEDIIVDEKIVIAKGTKVNKEILVTLREIFENGYNKIETTINEELDEYNNIQTLKIVDPDHEDKTITLIGVDQDLLVKRLTIPDIYSSVSYYLNLHIGVGYVDEIDHLANRRVRQVGELVGAQFKIGVSRMERVIRERMTTQDIEEATPKTLINIRPVTAALKEFFGSSQLSKFMDQINPIAELTDKRRLSSLGPGGLSRERAGMDVRDVNSSHYGRICPIESPEGQNIGLITSIAGYAKIDEYGFIMTPYRKVINGVATEDIEYLTANEETDFYISQATTSLDDKNNLVDNEVIARVNGDTVLVAKEKVNYMDVATSQVVSITASCIPFLEFDDANRTLMGANMQRQAVPLLKTESPIVGTGVEYIAARDSGSTVVCKGAGIIEYADSLKIVVKLAKGTDTYHLANFERSNAESCINHAPLVKVGDKVRAGQVLADGPSTENGELALGKNMTVAFMTYNGYNYEDAVILNEKLVKDDVYTSLHISHYDIECRDTKLGPEEITRDIPNVGDDARKNLTSEGIIRIGTEVKEGDILVGKVTPKGVQELTGEEKLLHAIFSEKAREVRDTSLRVENGAAGIVHDVKIYTKENSDELSPGVFKIIRIYIIQKRKIQVGDKMAGRHGNKGVISLVLPEEDMPYMPDGRPVDIMLNPLGVPSRMNIGQVLEVHLGMAGKKLGVKYATPVFDSASWSDIEEEIKEAGMDEDAKVELTDGRTGEKFDNKITVGIMYMVKLHHMVDDKLHARATGPYSLVTQQPLGGKAQFGGQRFGEMEVWALYAYGAAHILQEILTVKSDDIVGRVKVYESLVKGKVINQAGVPESFRVIVKEFQALGLNIQVINQDDEVCEFKDMEEDEVEEIFKIEQVNLSEQTKSEDNNTLEDKSGLLDIEETDEVIEDIEDNTEVSDEITAEGIENEAEELVISVDELLEKEGE